MLRVSACMATYNGEKYIYAQLESILKQLSWDDEVVISDDSSTDDTIEIIKSFNDKRIRLIENDRARNLVYNFEILPDFAAKRIAPLLGLEKIKIKQITPALTVDTVYARSYSYLNWLGLVLTFSFTMLASFVYIVMLRKDSVWFITGISMLNTLILFNVFANMFHFSGMSLQLLYPLIFSFVRKKKRI